MTAVIEAMKEIAAGQHAIHLNSVVWKAEDASVVSTDVMAGLIAWIVQMRKAVTSQLQPGRPLPRPNVEETNGFVTTEGSAFTGSGFATEHLTAVTEVTSRAVATLVARCKNSLVTTRSVSLLFSDAMVTMTAVTKATRGIVLLQPRLLLPLRSQQLSHRHDRTQHVTLLIRLSRPPYVPLVSFVVVAAPSALMTVKFVICTPIALTEMTKRNATSMNAKATMGTVCTSVTTRRQASTVRVTRATN